MLVRCVLIYSVDIPTSSGYSSKGPKFNRYICNSKHINVSSAIFQVFPAPRRTPFKQDAHVWVNERTTLLEVPLRVPLMVSYFRVPLRVPLRVCLRVTLRVPLRVALKVPLRISLRVPLRIPLRVPLHEGSLESSLASELPYIYKGSLN